MPGGGPPALFDQNVDVTQQRSSTSLLAFVRGDIGGMVGDL